MLDIGCFVLAVAGIILAALSIRHIAGIANRALAVVEKYQKELSLAAEINGARIKSDDVFAYNQKRLSDAQAAGRIEALVKTGTPPPQPRSPSLIADDDVPGDAGLQGLQVGRIDSALV
jgi:hypothetical protein